MMKFNCAECGRFFTDKADLSAHRVGIHDRHPALRRCLTEDEMAQGGWDSISTSLTDEPDSPKCPVFFRPSQSDQGTR